MKKNWMSVLSLLLNVALLAAVVYLGGKLEDTERVLRSHIDNAESTIQSSVDNIERNVERAIEEATKLVADYTMEPVGIDAENHTVEMNLDVQLQKWSADAFVDVEVVSGVNTYLKRLSIDSSGSCSGNLIFPVEDTAEVKLAAIVTMNGVTTREDLGGWGDITMLLPVQLNTWGGSVPRCQEGKLRIDDYHVSLDGYNHRYGIAVQEPEFRVYVNDKLAETRSGIEMSDMVDMSYVEYAGTFENMPCQSKDTVRLTFACRDDFGLGYEFTLGIWSIPAEDGELEELPMEMETQAKLIWE